MMRRPRYAENIDDSRRAARVPVEINGILHDSVQKNTDQIAALGGRIDALVHAVEIDAESISRLANIAAAH